MYQLNLLGSLELIGPDGTDHTPKLVKAQGLLAFLALAEGRAINRARLQDLLWSDRGPKQGRDSLRKALSELRACFKDVTPNPIFTDGGPVSLSLTQIDIVDVNQAGTDGLYRPEFLEGIDIADPEFNLWLAQIRSTLATPKSAPAIPQQQIDSHTSPVLRPLLEIGILPIVSDQTGYGLSISDLIVSKLSELFLESAIIRPFDYRMQSAPQFDGDGPDILMAVRHSRIGAGHFISLSFQATGSKATVFSASLEIDQSDFSTRWLLRKCAEIFDQLCEKLVRFDGFSEPRHLAAKRLFFAIDRIFRLSNFDLEHAGVLLEEACEFTDASTVYAWNAYLTAFRLEKMGAAAHPALMDQAESYARKALERDPHNALSVALVGHVYGFVLRDKSRASELLNSFSEQALHQPMLADTIAMHCYYNGDFKTAKTYAAQAVELGRFNPFRYSFTTSLAMTSLMCGELKPALQYCQAALAQHPVRGGMVFEPTLRTLVAAAGHAGERDVGRLAYENLAKQTGLAPIEHINEAAFPNRQTLEIVKQGMERLNA